MKRITITGLALGCALLSGQAWAHAFLQTASPAVGSTVKAAPAEMVLTFSEGVEPHFSTITVQDSSGARMDSGNCHLAGRQQKLAVGLKALQPGTYKVIWHAVSVDTHKTEGSFNFTVQP